MMNYIVLWLPPPRSMNDIQFLWISLLFFEIDLYFCRHIGNVETSHETSLQFDDEVDSVYTLKA